jgi:hypothetical protein
MSLVQPLEWRRLLAGSVVINELHVNPDNEAEEVEFLELHNPGDSTLDLSSASFTSGISYTFPAGTSLQAGGYLVVAQEPSDLLVKFGIAALGPWSGKLSNEGENVVLRSADGTVLDEVDYGEGFPWPTVGDAPGYSMELINPAFDNNIGGNWRSMNPQTEATLISAGSQWKYRKGTSEASSPTSAWRNLSFTEDSTWLTGTGTIGFDPTLAMGTSLTDMQNSYSSVFLRKTFAVSNLSAVTALRLEVRYDDGFNLWINGQLAKQVNTSSANLAYNATLGVSREDVNYQTIAIDPSLLQTGTNIIAVQLHNSSIGSNDCFFDTRLIATLGGVGPTPGKMNAVFSTTTPPLMRQLTQSVQQPSAGQDVTISIKATDVDGIQGVSLQYQLVDPGNYIRVTDATYQTSWTTLAMHDDGLNGDGSAGDSIYAVTLPGSLQTHRRLVRYRITATDTAGVSVRAPYLDDPSPNFAYFVYNGVPSWTGADQPGVSAPHTFGTDITNSGPAVYHIIANATDVTNSQYNSAYNDQIFRGTFVYDGVVYDHIEFRNRGEYSTYESGKNKWRINFNRGHFLAARDNYGRLYAEKLSKLNLNGNASPWLPVNRGMAGLDESVAYRLYQLAGVPSPNTHYVHLRVIDDSTEASSTDQYSGDLWGLYLAVEQTDSRFISEHNLADGNIYEIEYGPGDQKNQSPDQPSDGSDWTTFRTTASTTTAPLSWWQSNVNLGVFYSFTAMNRAVSNVDLLDDSNYIMYHAPDNLWQPMPWDLDMIYVPETQRSGKTYLSNSLVYPEVQLGLRNRAREVMDLMFSNPGRNGGQIGQLVEEFARMVNPSSGSGAFGTGWAELDQYLWNYNPRTTAPHKGAFYKTPMNETMWGGTYTRTLSTADYSGMAQWIINFMTDTDPDSWAIGDGDQRGYGFNYLEYEAADANIPNRPVVAYTGATGFALNQLTFNSSAFSDPNGSAFAAMEWRVGEISNPTSPGFDPAQPWKYEITPVWQSGEITTFNSSIKIPASALQAGHTYRVRVRMKDNTGRWSRWSDVSFGATEFTASATTSPLQGALRVTELNYNPASFAGVTDAQDMEFIELTNFSSQTLHLEDAHFGGITLAFNSSATLAPGQSGVVVRNVDAFHARYGTSPLILGAYGATGTNFSNGGEAITIYDEFNQPIIQFEYDDAWYPSTDGGGYSMEVVNPSADPDLGAASSWRASTSTGGSPGVVPDNVAPTIVGASFDYMRGKALVRFSEDVLASLQAGDIRLRSLLDSSETPATSFTYNGTLFLATLSFAPLPPDGNFQIKLPAGCVNDSYGNALFSDYLSSTVFHLAADATRDRKVDTQDFNLLAANFGLSGKVFVQGNFDYDAAGAVNSVDFNVFVSQHGKQVPSAGAMPGASLFADQSIQDDPSLEDCLVG